MNCPVVRRENNRLFFRLLRGCGANPTQGSNPCLSAIRDFRYIPDKTID